VPDVPMLPLASPLVVGAELLDGVPVSSVSRVLWLQPATATQRVSAAASGASVLREFAFMDISWWMVRT
jgi:hypothetical protein